MSYHHLRSRSAAGIPLPALTKIIPLIWFRAGRVSSLERPAVAVADRPPPADTSDGPARVFTELTSVDFAALARRLQQTVTSCGVTDSIGFRSPPRDPSRSRSVRRHDDGSVTISVLIRGRAAHGVAADMIDGIVHVAGIDRASETFSALWDAAAALIDPLVDGEPLGGQPARNGQQMTPHASTAPPVTDGEPEPPHTD